jgi:hypothetical protein
MKEIKPSNERLQAYAQEQLSPKEQLEKYKLARKNNLIYMLEMDGIDYTKLKQTEFDELLRMQDKLAQYRSSMSDLITKVNTILNPYRPISPAIVDEITHAPLEPEEQTGIEPLPT